MVLAFDNAADPCRGFQNQGRSSGQMLQHAIVGFLTSTMVHWLTFESQLLNSKLLTHKSQRPLRFHCTQRECNQKVSLTCNLQLTTPGAPRMVEGGLLSCRTIPKAVKTQKTSAHHQTVSWKCGPSSRVVGERTTNTTNAPSIAISFHDPAPPCIPRPAFHLHVSSQRPARPSHVNFDQVLSSEVAPRVHGHCGRSLFLKQRVGLSCSANAQKRTERFACRACRSPSASCDPPFSFLGVPHVKLALSCLVKGTRNHRCALFSCLRCFVLDVVVTNFAGH